MSINFSNCIERTLSVFPGYSQTHFYKENDQTLQYSFFFGFTQYLSDLIKKSSTLNDNELIERAFVLINDMLESGDSDLEDLVGIEIIGNLLQDKLTKQAARQYLSSKGNEVLEEMNQATGV